MNRREERRVKRILVGKERRVQRRKEGRGMWGKMKGEGGERSRKR